MSQSAVVKIRDIQYRVRENDVLQVPRLEAEVGSKVEFDEVLLLSGDDVQVGTPTIEGAKVLAQVVEHAKADKIIVFKMKRRKSYRRKQGHRQPYTSIKITSIEG